jgi:hypothetical protein
MAARRLSGFRAGDSTLLYESGVVSQYTGAGAQAAIRASSSSGVIGAGSVVRGSMMESFWPPAGGFWQGVQIPMQLNTGSVIGRFGPETGYYASPAGTSFGARALPPSYATQQPFYQYQVIKPFDVNGGLNEPWFGQPGMGTQYRLPAKVQQLIKDGYLKRNP